MIYKMYFPELYFCIGNPEIWISAVCKASKQNRQKSPQTKKPFPIFPIRLAYLIIEPLLFFVFQMKRIPYQPLCSIWTELERILSLLRIIWLKIKKKTNKSKGTFCWHTYWYKTRAVKIKPRPWMPIFNLNPVTKEQNALVHIKRLRN